MDMLQRNPLSMMATLRPILEFEWIRMKRQILDLLGDMNEGCIDG